jgi:hypothetical protein
MQVIEQAVKGTGGTNDEKLDRFCRKTTFKTVVGDVSSNDEASGPRPQVLAGPVPGPRGQRGIVSSPILERSDPVAQEVQDGGVATSSTRTAEPDRRGDIERGG